MKKTLSLVIVAVAAIVVLGVAFFVKDAVPVSTEESGAITVEDPEYYAKFRDKNITLNVYNWGEYISDGSEGSIDVIKEFEALIKSVHEKPSRPFWFSISYSRL